MDKVVAVASFVAMISIWLPWFTASDLGYSGSGSGTTVHGWLWLEFLVALVLIAYLVARVAWERLPFSMPVAHAPLLIVGTALQLLLVLIAFVDLPSGGDGISVGWGFGRLPRPDRRAGGGRPGPRTRRCARTSTAARSASSHPSPASLKGAASYWPLPSRFTAALSASRR